MKDCKTVRDDLKAYLDGQLPPASRLAVRLHLARCASCRKEMKAMEQIGKELREGAGKLDAGLRARILASVPPGAPPQPEGTAIVSRWRRRPMIFWGAAAAAVISWFVLYPAFAHMQEAPVASQALQTPPVPTNSIKTLDRVQPNGRMAHMTAGGVGTASPDALSQSLPEAELKISGRRNRAMDMAMSQKDFAGSMAADGAPQASVMHQKGALLQRSAPAMLESPLPIERQVHKEAEITLQVDQIEARSEAVEQMVNGAGGFVVNNELSTGDDNLKSASLTTKVPVAKFDSVLSRLTQLGEVKAKHVTGEDLTERISDQQQTARVVQDDITATKARLHTQQKPYDREMDQENLQNLKIRIAQEQARLDLYRKMAALATITVDLHEKPKEVKAPQTTGFLGEMNDTAHVAVHSFLQAARLPVLLMIWLVAYSPVWILLALAYRYAFRS